MKSLKELLNENKNIYGYKINTLSRESSELFFVHRSLETIRHTDTLETKATVYARHDGKMGSSEFTVYVSNNEKEIENKINMAYKKALLINNEEFDLPKKEEGSYEIDSNFNNYSLNELAEKVSDAVYKADSYKDGSINALEIFIYKNIITVENSNGLKKTQVLYDTMVEAIPTWNGPKESVELYEQYHFNDFNPEILTAEIDDKMKAVKARYEAKKPDTKLDCPVIIRSEEIGQLIGELAFDASYRMIYTKNNLHELGDNLQKNASGDLITATMKGQIKGSVHSMFFDTDGISLRSVTVIKDGVLANGFGSNQYSQYLKKEATGNLPCLEVNSGSMSINALKKTPYLECVSLSGIQIDTFKDYIGGEIRLGYYFDGNKIYPVTGISFSGKLSDALSTITLSKETELNGSYFGPKLAKLLKMQIL